jgi:hypothetical protein
MTLSRTVRILERVITTPPRWQWRLSRFIACGTRRYANDDHRDPWHPVPAA